MCYDRVNINGYHDHYDDDDDEDHVQETGGACIGFSGGRNTLVTCASPPPGLSSYNSL